MRPVEFALFRQLAPADNGHTEEGVAETLHVFEEVSHLVFQ